MDLIIVMGESRALLPHHCEPGELEQILPKNAFVFTMPWYSRTAGRYYHNRLLDFEEDLRLQAAAFALVTESSSGLRPALIFPDAGHDDAVQRRLMEMLVKIASLIDQPLTLHPYMISTSAHTDIDRAFGNENLERLLQAGLTIEAPIFLSSETIAPAVMEKVLGNKWINDNIPLFMSAMFENGLLVERSRACDLLSKCCEMARKNDLQLASKNAENVIAMLVRKQLEHVVGLR
ncbi:hypothetical protein [Celeribacter neptunius]|uniref:Uncharacterized protein n=1 Tax=Celeribacter neptunius TaxID=588602 RepID=A0A1I3SXC5_9RHOB|nr:hypothetical protein [Celeribacter neptunius]SFJ62529.1 hypothetical protein SAMN04487991_2603 [Celeribacter neptunius]